MSISRKLTILCCLLPSFGLMAQESAALLSEKLLKASGDSAIVSGYVGLIDYYSKHQADSFNHYTQQALNYVTSRGYTPGEARILGLLARIDANQGRIIISKQRAERALSLYRTLNNLKGVAETLHNLGALEADKGNYDIALKYFLGALHVYDTITDYHGQMLAYMNLGNLYLAHDDSANAGKYLRIAESISKKTPLSESTIYLYNVLGVFHAVTGDKDGALAIFKKDLELSDKTEFMGPHVECLLYLEEFYLEANDYVTASKYLDEGLRLSEVHTLPEMEANFLTDKARICEQTHPDSAIVYLERSRILCEHIQSKSFLLNVYNEVEALYERKGDYKNALVAQKKREKLKDSLFSINKTQEIESLGASFDQERSAMRIAQLELQHRAETRTRNIIVSVTIVIIIALVVLLLMYRRVKALYHQLVAKEKELKELNATKDKLFSIIGHDLRGPISSIPTLVDILGDAETTAEDRKFILESLKDHAVATNETLDKLLLWGKSVLRGSIRNPEQTDTKPIIRRNIELKKLASAEKNIQIFDLTPDHLNVFADASHFDFLLRNLLDNSVKFTRSGGTVTINTTEDREKGFVIFSVADNGIGISDEDLKNIFLPNKSTPGTAQEKGTGIGLMLCREFAIQNGGDLWVQSKEGEGTSFFFSVKKSNDAGASTLAQ